MLNIIAKISCIHLFKLVWNYHEIVSGLVINQYVAIAIINSSSIGILSHIAYDIIISGELIRIVNNLNVEKSK